MRVAVAVFVLLVVRIDFDAALTVGALKHTPILVGSIGRSERRQRGVAGASHIADLLPLEQRLHLRIGIEAIERFDTHRQARDHGAGLQEGASAQFLDVLQRIGVGLAPPGGAGEHASQVSVASEVHDLSRIVLARDGHLAVDRRHSGHPVEQTLKLRPLFGDVFDHCCIPALRRSARSADVLAGKPGEHAIRIDDVLGLGIRRAEGPSLEALRPHDTTLHNRRDERRNLAGRHDAIEHDLLRVKGHDASIEIIEPVAGLDGSDADYAEQCRRAIEIESHLGIPFILFCARLVGP